MLVAHTTKNQFLVLHSFIQETLNKHWKVLLSVERCKDVLEERCAGVLCTVDSPLSGPVSQRCPEQEQTTMHRSHQAPSSKEQKIAAASPWKTNIYIYIECRLTPFFFFVCCAQSGAGKEKVKFVVDEQAALERMSQSIRFKSISHGETSNLPPATAAAHREIALWSWYESTERMPRHMALS